MGGKSSPPAPDYQGAAEASGKSSQEMNTAQTWANRPNMTTPWGKQTYTASEGVDPATGQKITKWDQNVTLTPEMQASLDSQNRINQGRSGAAETLLGQATEDFQKPFDWGSLSPQSGNVSAGQMASPVTGSAFNFGSSPESQQLQTSLNGSASDYRQRAQDAVDKLQQPSLDASRTAATARLANQGITQGSEAYTNAMRDVDDSEARAHLMAIDSGRNESSQLFNQDLSSGQFGNQAKGQDFTQQLQGSQFENQTRGQDTSEAIARNQANNQATTQQFANNVQAGSFNNQNRATQINEQQLKRGMTLNELNALLTGQQVQNPTFGQAPTAGKAAGTDYTGAMNNQYNAALDSSNASNAQNAQTWATVGTLASMFAFSDIRLKEDVIEVGILSSGVRVVHYRYRGRPTRRVGVIAQDVARIIPNAVILDPSGYLMVDYSKVF